MVLAQLGGGADEPFISEIGTLLPMAQCGRKQTSTFAVGYFVTKSVAQTPQIRRAASVVIGSLLCLD